MQSAFGVRGPSRLRRAALIGVGVAVGTGCSAGAPPEADGTSQTAMQVCSKTMLNGTDVSHHNGTVDWPTLKTSGIDFAYVKATEGTTFIDPMFASNWAAMKTNGIVRGAYHYFHSNVDPVMQADYVMQTVGALGPGDLPIALDLEATDGQSESVIVAGAIKFLSTVTAASGRTAILYVSSGFLSDYSSFAGTPLWVANWLAMCPDVPAPWATWAFWQNSSTGTVSGVPSPGATDLDNFNGTLAQLQAFGGGDDAGADAASDGEVPPTDASRDGSISGNDAESDGNGPASADGGGPDGDRGNGFGGPGISQSSGCSIGAPGHPPIPASAATSLMALALGCLTRRRRPATTRS
jgi:GH25 family lysozyme M1 (1,4-beta-N-acetylmuramidase)